MNPRTAWKFAGWLNRFTSAVVSWAVWLAVAAFLVVVVMASVICCGRGEEQDDEEPLEF